MKEREVKRKQERERERENVDSGWKGKLVTT